MINIFVGNIPYAATEDDLKELFQEYGPVATATIIRDRYDGRSKGFGFVEMENQTDGERAIEALDGHEMMGRPLKVNPARPRDQRRGRRRDDDNQSDRDRESESLLGDEQNSSPNSNYFHNPYTFVPTPPRPSNGFAGDFNPLKHPSGAAYNLCHSSLKDHLWTGHIPIKLTTVTPLVLPKTEGDGRSPNDHHTYDVLDYLREPSLRGMLRSAYEVVTNSRYGCFGKNQKERLAYRMDSREAPKLIPAIIREDKKSGKLFARLYTGTSYPTINGPKRNERSNQNAPMYAAMLTLYPKEEHPKTELQQDHKQPKTGDKVWAEIILCRHERPKYLYWKASRVWRKRGCAKPDPGDVPKTWRRVPVCRDKHGEAIVRIVKGRVLITNENINKKHDERIFFDDNPSLDLPDIDITNLKGNWDKLIKNYREAHPKDHIFNRPKAVGKPWKRIGDDPGETAWSPHLYKGGTQSYPEGAIKLESGDMVYARCEFNSAGKKIKGIKDLFPVTISRELYEASPRDLLPCSLRPAKRRSELSPADRLFGWVPQLDSEEQHQEDQTVEQNREREAYKGRIRVVCENGPRPEIIERFDDNESLPLSILGQPKVEQGRFYVAQNSKGEPQTDGLSKKEAGYSKQKGLRGRKQYWHHKGLAVKPTDGDLTKEECDNNEKIGAYWKPSVEDRTRIRKNGRYQEYRRPDKRPDGPDSSGWQQKDGQNRSIIGWIRPGVKFKASLYVQNLRCEEVGALLWLLTLNERYQEDYYFRLGYGKPLGFGSVKMEVDWNRSNCINEGLPLAKGEGWKTYYTTFDSDTSVLAKLDRKEKEKCIQDFQSAMKDAYKKDEFESLSFISGFLRVLAGPADELPIHYPRLEHTPNPEGKNFDWFTANERGIPKTDTVGKRCLLPEVTKTIGLPYKPVVPKKST